MSKKTLGIYIHVPFCRQRCSYCHFQIKVFHPQTDSTPFYQSYREQVTRELAYHAERLEEYSVTSVFYGGGTPSRLETRDIELIQETIAHSFDLSADCEISMEANPEDVSPVYLGSIRDSGVNRVSFGVQTFEDSGLQAIKRVHDSARAKKAILDCPTFSRGKSIDLILGLPYQTRETLKRDLVEVVGLGLEHVSLYMLERDLPTPLDRMSEDLPMPSDDDQADFYDYTCQFLREKGFDHYEISNFCKPGYQSRHNLRYWTCGDYLGVGPAAHGRIGLQYSANHPGLKDYLDQVARSGHGTVETEIWTDERFRQEQIIQGLRLSRGVAADLLTDRESEEISSLVQTGLVWAERERIGLTVRGRLLANEVFQVFV